MSSGRQDQRAVITIQGAMLSAASLIGQFANDHRVWFRAHVDGSPVYRLPLAVIQQMQRPALRSQPLLDADTTAAETEFTAVCDQFHAVGFWSGQPVIYPYLTPRVPFFTTRQMAQCGWSRAQIAQTQQLERKATDAALRLKGYAGWLVVDQQFLSERDALASTWQTLPATQRPGFPLKRSIAVSDRPQGSQRASPGLTAFQAALDAFLDRWGLTKMATWDLPEPQGPLIPALLPANSPAMPSHGLHIVLPVHYPLTANDGLLRDIQQQQARLARDNNLDASVAGLPHYEVLAQMLEVEYLEQAIRRRYGRPGNRGGFVMALEAAIAAGLNVRVNHVKRLRKGISSCKRGQRSSVRWLRSAR